MSIKDIYKPVIYFLNIANILAIVIKALDLFYINII